MVEFLGPELLGPLYNQIAKEIIKYCNHQIAAVRQASAYGIGIMAEKAAPEIFKDIVNDALQGLKIAIEYQIPANVKEKKNKTKQFMHAKDNAVSAFGKIIRYQSACIDVASLIPNWLGLLPIKNDVEEAKLMNDYVALFLSERPQLLLGE